jgi:hypothetical protein
VNWLLHSLTVVRTAVNHLVWQRVLRHVDLVLNLQQNPVGCKEPIVHCCCTL